MTRLAAAIVVLTAASAAAQTPTFEVASIKRNTSGSQQSSVRAQPGRVTITNTTLFTMIRDAHQREAFEISGGPEWMHSDRWDIVAKAPANFDQPTILAMARALLADRFKLVVHMENRELPVYALVRAGSDSRLGPQLQPSSVECPKTMAEMRARDTAGPSRAANGAALCSSNVSPNRYLASSRSMADVARVLAPLSGRKVVDNTGLGGTYDLDLTWSDSAEGPSLFTALQEQLGLKLDSQRGPVEVLVIDSVERAVED
jgi:uncharacterized protein (TIGR03435 family)